MATLILGTIFLVFVWGIFTMGMDEARREKRIYDGKWFGLFFLGAAIVVTGVVIFGVETYTYTEHEPTVMKQEIISLGDGGMSVNGSISGGLFITTGYINSSPVYIYYVQHDDGAIVQHNVATYKAKVYEDTDTEAYLQWEECEHVEGPKAWPIPMRAENCEGQHWTPYSKRNFEFHVPPGTVIRDFRLDSE